MKSIERSISTGGKAGRLRLPQAPIKRRRRICSFNANRSSEFTARRNECSDAVTGSPIGPEPIVGESASATVRATSPKSVGWLRKTLKIYGPGLATGAADDDPSGIATYSSVGAQFGPSMLWTMPLIYPFMAAIQDACSGPQRPCGPTRQNVAWIVNA
jgi:hypothetical protein